MRLEEVCDIAEQAVAQVHARRKAGFAADDNHLGEVDKHAERVFALIQDELSKTSEGKRLVTLNGHPFDDGLRAEFRQYLAGVISKSSQFERNLRGMVLPRTRWHRYGIVTWLLRWQLNFRQCVLLLLGLALVVYGAVGSSFVKDRFGTGSGWLIFWVAGEKVAEVAIGALLVGIFAWLRGRSGAKLEHRHAHFQQITLGAARRLQRDARDERRFSGMQAELFALSVLRPADVRQRVTETYIPNGSTVKQEVTIEVQLPLSSLGVEGRSVSAKVPQIVYFPMIVAPKGVFQDNLEVYDADGKQLPRLTYREYLKLAACTLRSMLSTGVSTQVVRRAELHALLGIAQRQRCDAKMDADGSEPGWRQLQRLAGGSPQARQPGMRAATEFARQLHTHYVVVVAVTPDDAGRFIVKYRQALIPEPTASRRFAGLSRALGARPVQLIVNLNNASTCQSFHAQAQSPDYLYLGRQDLTVSRELLTRVRDDAPTPVHMRFRRRLGQSYGHMYCRFFPEDSVSSDGATRSAVRFTFYEIPPASVFRAVIASMATFLLVWSVGLVMSRVSDAGTDAPAILLAFPAAAAALVGFDKPQRSLLDSTLAARISLMLTAILSVAASALFMLFKVLGKTNDPNADTSVIRYDWPHLPSGVSLIGVTSIYWSIITLLALVNTCLILWICVSRYSYYAYLNSRNPREDIDGNVGA